MNGTPTSLKVDQLHKNVQICHKASDFQLVRLMYYHRLWSEETICFERCRSDVEESGQFPTLEGSSSCPDGIFKGLEKLLICDVCDRSLNEANVHFNKQVIRPR